MPRNTPAIPPPPAGYSPIPRTTAQVPVLPEPVRPSTAQVISAAVQNVAALAALTYGWAADKLDTTVAVVAILLVVGIDFAGRKKLTSSTTAAVTFGATGVLHALGVGGAGAALALATSLLVGGCAPQLADLPRVRHALDALQSAYSAACLDSVEPACVEARKRLNEAEEAHNALLEALASGDRE